MATATLIIRMERMDPKRWVRICCEEIKRGVNNKMATVWRKEMERRLAGNGEEW